MDKLVNMCLSLNKVWKQGKHDITTLPDYQNLLAQFPLPFPIAKFQKQFPDKISIKNLYVHDDLRLSIYLVPKGKVMQAHDHPDMFVLSHIMMGKALVRSYTHKQKDLFSKEDRIMQKHQNAIISGKQRNIHQFQALQNTIIFDILFPDYDDERPGTTYKLIRKQGDLYVLHQDNEAVIQMQQML